MNERNIYLTGICLILLFVGMDIAEAIETPDVHRFIFVSNRNGSLNSEVNIDRVVSDSAYMNVDAIMLSVTSEYFEAVRDPFNKGEWDRRASWNMLEYAITEAHEKNIQLYVWIPVNYVSGDRRAERRLFGHKYDVVERDGTPFTCGDNCSRSDLAFDEIFHYEIDLFRFIAKHYPDLDGIMIEEPEYPFTQSYTTAMRNRIKAKYGYDPLTKPETEMRPVIDREMTQVMNEFFTELKKVISGNKTNPDLLLAANAGAYYLPQTGFDPEYMSRNHLLDWYAAQVYRNNTNVFIKNVHDFKNNITEIPLAAIATIIYEDRPNPDFFMEIEKAHDAGADIVGVYVYHSKNVKINGTTAMEGLHDMPTDRNKTARGVPKPNPSTQESNPIVLIAGIIAEISIGVIAIYILLSGK